MFDIDLYVESCIGEVISYILREITLYYRLLLDNEATVRQQVLVQMVSYFPLLIMTCKFIHYLKNVL